MPAAVIMEENFDKLLEQCEAQELEVCYEKMFESFQCVLFLLVIDFGTASDPVWR